MAKTKQDISSDATLMQNLTDGIGERFKEMIYSAEELGMISEIDAELENDPDFKKAFSKFNKDLDKGGENKSVDRLNREMESISSMVMSMTLDPNLQTQGADKYNFPYERVAPLLLRRAGNSMAARMIKAFRFHQLSEFARTSDGKRPGFRLAFRDEERKITDAERKKINEVEKIIADKFFFVPNETKPNFSKWLTLSYQDFFDLDKISIEIIRQTASANKKYRYRGLPLAFQLVDAGTVFHVVPKVYQQGVDLYRWDLEDFEKTKEEAGIVTQYIDEIRYIQVDKVGQKRTGYTEDKMILSHAFGTTDIREAFQGLSIVEQSLQVIRYLVDSILYNATRRSTGTMPKGMINVEGATEDGFSRREMALFRKLIWGISSGRSDKWKYPIVGTPKGVKTTFIKFHDSSKEMEDFLWFSTLISVMCAYAGLDPEELSLASQKNVLGKQKLFSKNEEEGVAVRSQDEGLRFFLNHLAGIFGGSHFVEELSGIEGLEFTWCGLDVEDEAKKVELDIKRLGLTTTVNDLLVAQDKDKAELLFGDINIFDIPGIANSTTIQLILQALQGQAEEGMEEEEEDPFDQYGGDNSFGSFGASDGSNDVFGEQGDKKKEQKKSPLDNTVEKSIPVEIIFD